MLWKAYIDFEIGEGQRARTRELYNRLLTRTGHVKVWLSYAEFEGTPLVLLRTDANELSEEERYACPYTACTGSCREEPAIVTSPCGI